MSDESLSPEVEARLVAAANDPADDRVEWWPALPPIETMVAIGASWRCSACGVLVVGNHHNCPRPATPFEHKNPPYLPMVCGCGFRSKNGHCPRCYR